MRRKAMCYTSIWIISIRRKEKDNIKVGCPPLANDPVLADPLHDYKKA